VLPDKFSDLIHLAINDYQKVLVDDRYIFDMAYWHEPINDKTYVCFAGCVIAKSLYAPPNSIKLPRTYHFDNARKLLALDYLSRGWCLDAGVAFGVTGSVVNKLCGHIPDPRYDSDGFLRSLDQGAKRLRESGL